MPVQPQFAIQRQVPMGQRQEVRNYYDLRIREIGSPTNRRHLARLQQILDTAHDAEEAKQRIREYIANWNNQLSIDAAPEPIARPGSAVPRHIPEFVRGLTSGEVTSNLPLADPRLGRRYFDMEAYRRLSYEGRLELLRELVPGRTPYELNLQQRSGGPEITIYRYHKFPKNAIGMYQITGGGFNKAEITGDFGNKTVAKLLKTRRDLLTQLGRATGEARAKLMEKFQANAMSTPFIATTSDLRYAAGLFKDYPPDESQIAVLLAIRGPMNRLFDFETEFQRLGVSGGGRLVWNWRRSAKRKKDAEQREYGISDLVIPMFGVSESGFRIVGVIRLN